MPTLTADNENMKERLAKAAAEVDALTKQNGALRAERDAATKAGAEVEALTKQQLKSRETIEALEAKFREQRRSWRPSATRRPGGPTAARPSMEKARPARSRRDRLNKQSGSCAPERDAATAAAGGARRRRRARGAHSEGGR